MGELENGPNKFFWYGLHKSFGISVLILVCLRLMWKLKNSRPMLPDSLTVLEKHLVKIAHALLYVMMFAMPLTGWLMSSAAGFSVSFFGLFILPDLIAPNRELVDLFKELHGFCAYFLIALVALHAIAALSHHFYHKNNVLRRILPFIKE